MSITPEIWATILVAVLGSGIIQFLIQRNDGKKKALDMISEKLDRHIEKDERMDIIHCRVRILAFADDVRRGIPRSKGSWDQAMEDIDMYSRYCDEHQDFRNGIATACEKLIVSEYEKHLMNNDFMI